MRISVFKKKKQLFDFSDLIEIIFGVLIGLSFFLGGSELWNIGAALTDKAIILIIILNFIFLYAITKLITGKLAKSSIFLESVKFPFIRSAVIYVIGFTICLATVTGLNSIGVINRFVAPVPISLVPINIKIAVFANLLATIVGATIDLSVVEK